jgi:plasmid maintenance system killer protein
MNKKIYINDKILKNIEKKWLLKQYEKVEKYLKEWNFKQISLKIREPKKDKVFYFRINKQYRLYCKIENEKIYIFYLDNHQN